jgi:acyl carrier protein
VNEKEIIMSETEARIRAFVVENFLFGDDSRPLGVTDSFIEHDLVDSTGILELVSFIEESFGIAMQDHEMVPANLDSISRIAAFVASRTEAGANTCAA